jgi:signal peptidase II
LCAAGTDADAAHTDRSAVHSSRRAFRSPAAIAAFLLVIAAGLAADLLSKHYVFQSLLGDPQLQLRYQQMRQIVRHRQGRDLTAAEGLQQFTRPVAPGVKFTLSTNPGVVFGLGMNRKLVGAATIVTVLLLLYLFAVSNSKDWQIHLAMGLIAAGALGNLYDRLFCQVHLPGGELIQNQVRDFINCSAVHYPWIFNVADALLVIGMGILAVRWVFWPTRQTKANS